MYQILERCKMGAGAVAMRRARRAAKALRKQGWVVSPLDVFAIADALEADDEREGIVHGYALVHNVETGEKSLVLIGRVKFSDLEQRAQELNHDRVIELRKAPELSAALLN